MNVYFKRSFSTVPLPTWDGTTQVTSSDDCSYSTFALDQITNRIHLLYSRTGSSVNYRYSDDEGESWSSEDNISSGVFPFMASNDDGDLVRSWIDATGLSLEVKLAGEDSWGAAVHPFVGITSSFQLCHHDRWVISFIGSGSANTYFSTDNCSTWTKLGSSCVTSGTDIRMSIAPNGDLVRSWLNSDSSISAQVFLVGDTNFGVEKVISDGSSNILVERGGWGSISFAYDYSQTLILSIVKQNENVVDEWISHDEATSFGRL